MTKIILKDVINSLIFVFEESESESHSVMFDFLRPHGLYSPWNSPGQNTSMGSRSLLQGIFPTQLSNLHVLHCRQILYQLSHQGSPSLIKDVVKTHPVFLAVLSTSSCVLFSVQVYCLSLMKL